MFIFWAFIVLSLLLFAIGVLFLVSPRWILVFLPEVRRNELSLGGSYSVILRIGGAVMAFLCAPLMLIVASGTMLDS